MADFDADGTTDPAIIRAPPGPNSQATWWVLNSTNSASVSTAWGLASDTFTTADFDGDFKDDYAVWRPGSQGVFYIIQSQTSTVRVEPFGTDGDDPTVVGDYNNDAKDDVAVYRPGATANALSFWYWMPQAGAMTTFQWGIGSDFPAPGDYDGDNRIDYAVQRPNGPVGEFYIRNSTNSSVTAVAFGNATDLVVPGDYDGDLKTDICVLSADGPDWRWSYQPSTGGPFVTGLWGLVSLDIPAPGDYNGDGRADFAIWRPGTQSAFWALTSGPSPTTIYKEWGTTDDVPVTLSYVH